MDQNEYRYEQQYRKVIGAIGISMLFFLLFLTAFQMILIIINTVLSFLPEINPWIEAAYQLIYAAGYLASFMTPVLILRKRIRRNKIEYLSMRTTLRFSKLAFLAIPLGISVIFSAAYLNARFVEFFFIPNIMEMLAPTTSTYSAYEIVIQFIVVCLVPGFCEEFLFRGAILTNCLPFGRSTAILISSLLFALMHQNVQQFFFAFVAGIFLGVLYEKTGSIWPGVLLHTLNNFTSTAQVVIQEKYVNDPAVGTLTVTLIESAILLLGVISLAILLPRCFGKRASLREGVFGQDHAATDWYASVPLSAEKQRKLFLRPPMIIFLIICVVEALMATGLVMLYGILLP